MSAKRSDRTSPDEILLRTKQVRERYDIVDMTIWRWLRDASLGFPRPIVIRERRYWRLSELERWERTRASRQAS